MSQTRTERTTKFCGILNQKVQLIETQDYASLGLGVNDGVGGEWITRQRNCSEYRNCEEDCKWARGTAHSQIDPMRNL